MRRRSRSAGSNCPRSLSSQHRTTGEIKARTRAQTGQRLERDRWFSVYTITEYDLFLEAESDTRELAGTVRLPHTVKRIYNFAFSGTQSLKAVVPSDKLKVIGEQAFWLDGI